MSSWTDTHAHIYLEDFVADRQDMLERAQLAGIEKIYMPNIDHRSIDEMMELEGKNPGRCYSKTTAGRFAKCSNWPRIPESLFLKIPPHWNGWPDASHHL